LARACINLTNSRYSLTPAQSSKTGGEEAGMLFSGIAGAAQLQGSFARV
jgi:hypothetical protein